MTTTGKKEQAPKKNGCLKIGLLTLLIGIVLIGAGITYVLTNVNRLVENAIEKYGSEATQTAVRVEKVDLKLKEGSLGISNFTIGNPPGFAAANCFTLGVVLVDIDLASLTTGVIGLDEIVVKGLEVSVEVNADNKNNLNELRKNLPQPEKPAETGEQDEPAQPAAEPKLSIKHILFAEGKISALVVPLKNKTYHLKMPRIEMNNLQGTSTEITKQIIDKLTKQALAEVKKQGIDYLKETYGDDVEKELKKQQKKLTKELKKKLTL